MRGFFTGWFLIFIFTCYSFAQSSTKSLPIQFNQYMRAFPLINPASNGLWAKTEINTGVQRQTGNWNNVSTYYVNAAIRLTRDVRLNPEYNSEDSSETTEPSEQDGLQLPTRYHVAGITLTGDKEGEFLSRTGIYGLYAWHTRLSERVSISGGIAVGVKNYSVGDNYINGGGSAFAPDGSIGVWLYSPGSHIGFSVNQLFNGKLTPIRETTILAPYYAFTAGKSIELNRSFSIKPSTLIRAAYLLPMDVDLSLMGLIQNIVSAGVNYKIRRGINFMVGIEKIKIQDHYFKMMFGYYVPRGNYYNYVNINTYEITLNYLLKPNLKKTIFLQ